MSYPVSSQLLSTLKLGDRFNRAETEKLRQYLAESAEPVSARKAFNNTGHSFNGYCLFKLAAESNVTTDSLLKAMRTVPGKERTIDKFEAFKDVLVKQ